MTTILLSIGDELILGQTVDTNSAWLARECAAIGAKPLRHTTVSDSQEMVEMAILEAAQLADVLLITGGLGPTEDDLTRDALASVLEVPLKLDPAALENVERFFKALNREMPLRNKVQAMLPRGTSMIENTCGTAPGIRAMISTVIADDDDEPISENECHIFVMPGVPKEMKAMFTRSILPAMRELQQQQGGKNPVILSKTLHTFGQGESNIAELLKPANLMARDRNPSVGTTVSGGVVSLRLNAYYDTPEEAKKQLADTESKCREILGDLIYGADEDTIPSVVAKLLVEKQATVATAESCTGGLLAKMLTDIPGSSAFFKYGWVTYSNEAKDKLLGVPNEVLAKVGAVSQEVVESMANNAQSLAGADTALSISGIAGPDGGTPEKPVGTVWIGFASFGEPTADQPTIHPLQMMSRQFLFHGDREMIRDRSAKMALTLLRFHLLGKPLPF